LPGPPTPALEVLQRARAAAAEHAESSCPGPKHSGGLAAKVSTDGSTLSLADTPANQRAYPQLQKPAARLRLSAAQNRGASSAWPAAPRSVTPKATNTRRSCPCSFVCAPCFKKATCCWPTAAFCSYVVMALLEMLGVACLFRLHHARPNDLREGIRLGKKDRLVVWRKPQQKPRYLPKALWRRVPEELTVRVLRVKLEIPGFRTQTVTLATTLSDAEAYPAEELAGLILRRWRIELWGGTSKTSMGRKGRARPRPCSTKNGRV